MRNAGVPFGISTTATDQNAELLISKKMIDFYFKEQGALYQWLFQYMPIGRGADVGHQVSPEVRTKMWGREQEIVNKERLPLVDFWNGGPYSAGCIAGGRPGKGYAYIDWQESYNHNCDPATSGNLIRPCFIRDHHKVAHDLFIKTEAKPGYESAAVSLKDKGYYNRMTQYDKELAELLDPIWEDHYRKP